MTKKKVVIEEVGDSQQQAQDERFPRRAAKRLKTRARILEAALAQFQKVGYADATIASIAEAADVHVTTLFTHFKTKRDLANGIAEDEIVLLERLIEEAKGVRPFFEFFRELVLSVAEQRQRAGDHKHGIRQELQNDPELALGWLRYEDREVRLLADYLAHDYGLKSSDYAPLLVAQALISSGVFSYESWRANQKLDLVKETEVALDNAERMARAILPLRPVKP